MTDLAIDPQGEGACAPDAVSNPTHAPNESEETAEFSPDALLEDGESGGDDTADIEHEGQTYRVPKALKGAFLMHADYTRKTQEVAEQRRTLAEQDAALARHAQMQNEHAQDFGRVLAYEEALAPFEQLDWHGLRAHNPAQAQVLWSQYTQLRSHRDQAANHLQAKVNNWQQASEAQTARRIAESHAILSRDIKDWSPELSGTLKDFGIREFGFTPDEVASVTDPRLIKVLHRAMIGDQMTRRAAAAARAAEAEGVKPLPQLGNNASATRWSPTESSSDRSSTAEWMRRRNEQLRRAK